MSVYPSSIPPSFLSKFSSTTITSPSIILSRIGLLSLTIASAMSHQAIGALTVSGDSFANQSNSQYAKPYQENGYPITTNSSYNNQYSQNTQYSHPYNQSQYQQNQYRNNSYNDAYNVKSKPYSPNQYNSNQYSNNSYNSNSSNGYGSSNSYNSANSYHSTNSHNAYNSSNNTYPTANQYYPVNPYSSTNQYGSLNSDRSVNYFSEARQAGSRHDNNALYEYEQKMQGDLFAMYPEYWRLNNQINSLAPSTVVNFANRYPKSVMAEKLVADYAENKAKTFDYQAIQQVAPYVINADKSEACALAIGDSQSSSLRVAEQKSKVWLNTLKQPTLCNQLATALASNPMINNQDRLDRLFRMLRVGKTGDIINLSAQLGTPISYSQLQDIQYDSSSFFSQFTMQPYNKTNQYLYLYAIGKLTDQSYREAVMQLNYDIMQDNQRPQHLLDEQTRRMAYRTIAVKRMNMNTNDGFHHEAVEWFRKSLGEPFNYEEAEDYAMAGIRFSEWQDVINAISNMDASHQQKDIWRYWLARAYEQTGKQRKARSLYKKVAKKNNYYGFLAKDKLGQPINLESIGAQMGGARLPNITPNQRQKMLKNQHFARAFALHPVNKQYAKREWNWGVKQAILDNDLPLLLSAGRHAHDLGWYDRSIYAMEKANEEINKLNVAIAYPTPRRDSVIRYANQAGIDPAWAYGIMRQESRFNVSARSSVGAGGLMQIMPSTGKYIARKLGEPYRSSNVASGDTNIRYGTWYMGDVLNSVNGQAVLATAGYNAGPSKAKRWQPEFRNLSADQYVDTIPYPETRNYVKRVMENSTIYGHILGHPLSIQQRMGTVYPK